jgi:hypothetical protein
MKEPINNTQFQNVHLRAARTLLIFWLLGWFLKADFYIPYLYREVILYPFSTDFFPVFFKDPLVLQFFYALPVLALGVFFRPNTYYLNISAVTMVISSFMLLLHQDTHNDVTFLTSFWVGIWYFWFVNQFKCAGKEVFIHARSLALCLVSVIFLGGFIGKVTREYWSGEVFADIFMRQNFGWIGQWVRGHFTEDAIRWGFWWVSKFVIVAEGILAFAPLWPTKFVQILGIALMLSISTFTTWRIFSVLFSLIGLLYILSLLKGSVDSQKLK